MALGAEQARVLRMVLGEVAVLIVAGLVLGLAVAVSSTRLLASFLYRLEPNDPTTLVTACVVLAVPAVVAGLMPARRAANLDPMTALREESAVPSGIGGGQAARLKTARYRVDRAIPKRAAISAIGMPAVLRVPGWS